jgi:DNA ligase-4
VLDPADLQKDYIPNLGDCIDLVLLGAGWDADRARDLRVDTSVFTSFYVGVLTNHAAVKAKLETPHFEVIFKVSYGLSRAQLEEVNGCIRHGRWGTKRYDKDDRFKRVRLAGLGS